jgi:hypothetical protein
MHLTPEQFIDLVEGASAESAAGHLQTCERCRTQLADLRELRTISATGGDVPEPSPLFWNQLSARVHEAIAAEGEPRVAWWRPSTWPWLALPVGAGAMVALVLAFVLTSRGLEPVPVPEPTPIAASAPDPVVEDASLSLVADLAAQMDWDSASEIGAPLHAGAADEAIGDLSPAERRELQRLLQELARPGA